MSKKIKILTVALMVTLIVLTIGSSVFASDSTKSLISGIAQGNTSGTSGIQNLGKSIVGIIQVVGIIGAIVILMVVGVKYMMGSAEEKAEYKKVMIPYVIGAILLFAASQIVTVVYNFASAISIS